MLSEGGARVLLANVSHSDIIRLHRESSTLKLSVILSTAKSNNVNGCHGIVLHQRFISLYGGHQKVELNNTNNNSNREKKKKKEGNGEDEEEVKVS